MKKILLSLSVIAVVAAMVAGGTMSFFSDTETSIGNTFTAGTIDIAIDGNNHWQESFVWDDIKPGKDFDISFEITNVGKNPLKLWKIIKCVVNDENGIIEPEQAWYNENNVVAKNDLDSVIIYEMEVDGQMVVNKEAGITLDKIKDNYIGLVKLDIGMVAPQYGILNSGDSVNVIQRYYMPDSVGNWAQSDSMTFIMEIEARQTSAPEPLQQISFMENKDVSGYASDQTIGILKYDYVAPEFNYNFFATGLDATSYQLIYYPDPWNNSKEIVLIGSPMISVDGVIEISGQSADLGMDLANTVVDFDENYPYGAKIWLVPVSSLNSTKLAWGDHVKFLFDNWPGLINYRQGDRPNEEINCDYNNEQNGNNLNPTTEQETIYFNDLGANPQYGYTHDYANANVSFTYDEVSTGRLSGTVTATGLKPYATYQMKLEGKPTCLYGAEDGDDTLNNYIGSIGRWWDNDLNQNGNTAEHCNSGYLVWDFITADANGNVSKQVETSNSYHVLRCSGGTCGDTNDSQLMQPDVSHPDVYFCAADDVNGELEHDTTIPCNGLTLNADNYDLKFVLTEESFHKSPGTWTAVMDADIQFEIE